METIITTVKAGRYYAVRSDQAAEFKPESVREWRFEHRDIGIQDELAAGAEVVKQGLIAVNGARNMDGIALAKGRVYLQRTLTGWNRETQEGEPLPISTATIDTLPVPVITEFWRRVEYGDGTETESDVRAASPATAE